MRQNTQVIETTAKILSQRHEASMRQFEATVLPRGATSVKDSRKRSKTDSLKRKAAAIDAARTDR